MDSHKNTIFDSKVLSATLRAVAQSSSNEEKVGEGFSAHVRRHEIDNKAYAVKFLQWSDKGSDRIIKEFEREVAVFEAIHNSNSNLKDYIIGYYGSYRENNQAIIILELADTDALKILQCQSQPFSVEFSNPTNKTECTLSSHGENNNPNHFWMKILLDISKSFQLLHSLGYYHRDFHLMNCLFLLGDTKHSVKTKLGDFGGSLHQKDAPITWIGHSRFSAPEVLSQKKAKQPASNYSFASDVFMFGMAMYEILHGYQGDQRIWVEHGNFEMSSLIIKGERPPITQNNCNPDYVKLMQECWSQNPSQRPSFEVIYKRLSDMMNAKQRVQIKKDDKVKGHERIHTYHLYLRDEVMSVLQKSVRRGLVEDALYWASELDQSGQGKSAIDRLTVVASEDASLSVPHMPIYVNQLHKEYYTYIGGHNKEKSRKALFRLAEVLCQINKCRSANNACGYTLAIMEERIEKAMNNPNSNDYELLNTPDHSFLKILQKYMEESRTKFEQEEKALFLLQRLYMELDDKGFHIWEKDLWDLVCSLTTKHEITKQTIEALRELTLPRHIGGESGCRLRLFHAVVLYTRELYLDFTIEIPPTQIEYEKTYEKLCNKPGLEGRHPEGIPFYAVDRHNRRGKGGKADTYFMHGDDTSNYITTGATEWKLDISNWPIEEIAKSHGPGRRFFKNHNTGKPTLITQFFYEGSNVYKEYLPPIAKDKSGNVIDPYRQKAADYYEFIEELHGSNNSKSACITPHHRSLIQKLQERRGFSSIDVKNLAIEDENKNATDEKPVKKERKNRVQGSWSGKQ